MKNYTVILAMSSYKFITDLRVMYLRVFYKDMLLHYEKT